MGKREYTMLSHEDSVWLRQQDFIVVKLWLEVAEVDSYGHGAYLKSQLARSSFFKAKKVLEEAGLCRFEVVCGESDGRNTRWFVTNLHGSRTAYYDKNVGAAQESYGLFLQSKYWQEVRDRIIERDGRTCQTCGSQTRLQVHHLTYEHHGEEHLHPEDLITLCRSCHEEVHGLGH